MESSGRQTKNHGRDEATSYYEQSGDVSNPSQDVSSDSIGRNELRNESSANSTKDFMEQMHAQPTREFHHQDKPSMLTPIQVHESFHPQGVSVDSDYNSSKTDSTYFDKLSASSSGITDRVKLLGQPSETDSEPLSVMDQLRNAHNEAIENMQGNSETSDSTWKDKISSFFTGNEEQPSMKTDNQSVMDSLREAHSEAISNNQNKSTTETMKEKFGEVKDSVTSMLTPDKEKQTTMDKMQEKMSEFKNSLTSTDDWAARAMPDPLPSKEEFVATPGDIPDPNFLQNA